MSMPRTGDELFDPIRGQRIAFRKTAQDANRQTIQAGCCLTSGFLSLQMGQYPA